MFGTGLVFPLYFQLLHHAGPVETGLRLLSVGGGTALALPLCGRLVDRWSAGPVAVAGTASCLLATGVLLRLPHTAPLPVVQAVLLTFGIALAFAAVPPTIAAYKAVPAHDLSQATTQVNIVQRLGGALGGAAFTVVIARALDHDGADVAFRAAFLCIAAVCALALASSATMVAVQHRLTAQTPTTNPSAQPTLGGHR